MKLAMEIELNDKAKEKLRRLRDDFPYYAKHCLRIQTKDGKEQELLLNETQQLLEGKWREQQDKGLPVRLLILKARQEGVSTYIDGKIFHRIATSKNLNGQIVSHDEDSVNHLFNIIRLYYDRLPDPLRPMRRYSNRKELVFENPDDTARRERPGLRSRVSVALARNLKAGRSKTLQYLHLSEAAFYPDLRTLLSGILQAVPDNPDTAVVIETTANGIGDEFHKLWQKAKNGLSQFIPIFIPWYLHKEYRLEFRDQPERDEFLKSLTEEEEKAQKNYSLSAEQLQWRRKKKASADSDELFFQEYPENDVDCFLSSGRPVFSGESGQALKTFYALTKKTPPKWQGDLTEDEDGTIRFIASPKGNLKLWKLPGKEMREKMAPVIGADVAEGLEQGDYSSAEVIDAVSKEQIAEWHGHTDPDLFGDELYKLGWYFGEIPVAVEVNNHGLTTLTTLKKRGYSRLFTRRVPSPADPRNEIESLGWKTDSRTKPLMEDYLRTMLREGSVSIVSRELVEELLSYIIRADGSTGANESCYDDRAIAFMIALQAGRQHQISPQSKEIRKLRKRRILNQFSKPT